MIIGLIGGVGAGKSTVTDYLRDRYNYLILGTDELARELEEPGRECYNALVEAFGTGILTDGRSGNPIDKSKFAALIFSDPAAHKKTEEIVHPATWAYTRELISRAENRAGADSSVKHSSPDVVIETALPGEEFLKLCEEVWFVYTDAETRIGRLMATRGYSREKCLAIMENQPGDEEYIGIADYIIDNSGNPEETGSRVDELLQMH